MRVPFFLLSLLFFAATSRGQVPGAASYQAAIWDKEIVLPAGSYRAAKPIGVDGDFTVRTQPHTLIEGGAFLTRGGKQHYHIEGTLLRRCRFTTKMNAGGHFIDSVLEDCDFAKDDGWFLFWWSTRWKYDNCVFTKKVVRGDLYPLDYSVHASHCTVYSVKLPPVGFKEDNSWMGKDDMVFEKCRFVDCDVPQSFLACTKDCVFESCRFEPKTQLHWSKETAPLKVHAYYASGGSEPPSFINGPLSVEFEKEPMKGDFGSTIPHTQSGGRITLTKDRLSEQFAMLGTVPKKSSEIVDLAAAATPVPTVAPVVPAVATNPGGGPGAPAVNEIGDAADILRALPPNIEVMARGLPNPAGVEAANAFLAKNFVGRAAALRLMLASTQATTDDGYAYQATGKAQDVLYHGTTVPATVTGLFRAADAAPLAKVAAKSELPVRGVVRRAEFVGRGTTLGFALVVGEARVVDALSLRTAGVTAGPGLVGEAQIIGKWTVLVRTNAARSEQSFNADHALFLDGKRVGTWELTPTQFIAHLDGVGANTYDLPVRDGVLHGKDQQGGALTLFRQDIPMPPDLLASIVGRQEFKNGVVSPVVCDFKADGTFSGGDLSGRWSVFEKKLLVAWNGHTDWNDLFDLPSANGVIQGMDPSSRHLTLTRTGDAVPTGSPKDNYFGSGSPK